MNLSTIMRQASIMLLVLFGQSIFGETNIPEEYSLSKARSRFNEISAIPFISQCPVEYRLFSGKEYEDSTSITDIDIQGNKVWLATGNGVKYSPDLGETWFYYDSTDGIGRGGVSGLSASRQDAWIATAYDTTVTSYPLPAGSGMSYAVYNGMGWIHYSQPIDETDDDTIAYFGQKIPALPCTSVIQNVTYDISHVDSIVFITSFAGGLRKSVDSGHSWLRVLLPSDEMTSIDSSNADEVGMLNPYDNLNHRAFSVICYERDRIITVWCGTANGINKSEDGGFTWAKYDAQSSGITGDFVVALHRQTKSEGDIIWGATLKAEGEFEENGISFTRNNGNTWETTLLGKRAYNISSFGDMVLVATSEGVYRSTDGSNWEWFEKTVAITVYDVAKDTTGKLWIGTADGLLLYEDDEDLWHEINFGSAPYILSTFAPDTLVLPNTGFITDSVRIHVSDPDGVEDVSQVWFLSLMPNGEYANAGNPFYLQNDGNGIFSLAFMLSSEAQLGTYEWTFTAQDVSGNLSEPAIHYLEIVQPTGVIIDHMDSLPMSFSLFQNSPNPFNLSTTISYMLPEFCTVNLSVYNIAGQIVEVLIDEPRDAGYHTVSWNANNVSSGVYFFKITAGQYLAVKKCLLLK